MVLAVRLRQDSLNPWASRRAVLEVDWGCQAAVSNVGRWERELVCVLVPISGEAVNSDPGCAWGSGWACTSSAVEQPRSSLGAVWIPRSTHGNSDPIWAR